MGPDPAVAAVRRSVRCMLAGVDGPVLVACSGGADSLALAAAAAFEARRSGTPTGLITVDHGLQAGSAAQAGRVAAVGYELGMDPVHLVRVRVDERGGPEAAARAARYAALAATGATVLLGHTLDDQAETVLLGLGRGSGPRSIAGMRPVDGRYRRPLLGVRRSTTRAACAALGLEPWDDPHNVDPRYQRVRLREEALPLLEEILQGGVVEALARTAALTRADVEALDELASAGYPAVVAPAQPPAAGPPDPTVIISVAAAESGFIKDDQGTQPDPPAQRAQAAQLDIAALSTHPAAIRGRMLRRWAHETGVGPLTSSHLTALDALVTRWHGQGGARLPGGFVARRASGRLMMHVDPEE
jgi:tRNA(Ile)-lysidine synthase